MERYDGIARCIARTDEALAVQLVALLHRTAGLEPWRDPGVARARELQTALRLALADLPPPGEPVR